MNSRYVKQFDPNWLSLIPSSHSSYSNVDSLDQEHPDYDVFQAYVSKGSLKMRTDSQVTLNINSRDALIYNSYVTLNQEVLKDPIKFGKIKPSDVPRSEAYSKWISTGVFVGKEKK